MSCNTSALATSLAVSEDRAWVATITPSLLVTRPSSLYSQCGHVACLHRFLAAKETKKNEESLAPEVTGTAALLASVDAQQAASAASAKAVRSPAPELSRDSEMCSFTCLECHLLGVEISSSVVKSVCPESQDA